MADKAQLLTSPATVLWSNGQVFDGFVLLALSLPTGHDKATVGIGQGSNVRIPLWTRVPIREGVIDAQSRVWFNNVIEPPGTRYAAHWYAGNKQLIALGAVVFEISTDPHTLTVPTLTAPATATGVPTPEAPPGVVSQTIFTVSGLLTIETPAGTIDGVNATFTVSAVPLGARLLVIKNGVTLKSGTGYTLSGSTITFLAGYIPQVGDVLLAAFQTG